MGEQSRYEGVSTCRKASYVVGETRSAVRNSANNCWNVNLNNGNVNNNNTYNRYYVVGASESFPDCDGWIAAERSFFKNKHDSVGAQRLHNHPANMLRIARIVAGGSYHPRPGYCFPLKTPTPREIYAAFCSDRLVHHYVAPFIAEVAESVHNANGDVSHGNRKGHSAQTGAEQIRDAIIRSQTLYPEPYVVKVDIKSFFSSIPRERAYRMLEEYAKEFYDKPDRAALLAVCKTLILHNPVEGCIELQGDWSSVPAAKRLKNAKEGHGLPIGNFYSQLIANLYLASLDKALRSFGVAPRFVDDKCGIVKDKEAAKTFVRVAREEAGNLGLQLHPDKIYMQPAHKGVNFCGRTIKGDRIYLSNRTIRRCYHTLQGPPVSLEGARDAAATVNSYLGLMCHCTEFKNQQRLCRYVLGKFGKWLYFTVKNGKLTCKVKKEFTVRSEHRRIIDNITKCYYETCKTNRRRNSRVRGCRGREGNRWTAQ